MKWNDNPAVKRWVLIIVVVVVAFWLFNALVSSPSDATTVWNPWRHPQMNGDLIDEDASLRRNLAPRPDALRALKQILEAPRSIGG